MKRIIDKLKIHNRVRVGYGTAFFLLLISYLITLYYNQQLLEQSQWVDHTNNTIIHLERIMSNLKDAETGAHGYAVMKDLRYLDPYYTSRERVNAAFKLLNAETADNKLQRERLDTLKKLIDQKFVIIQGSIIALRESNFLITDTIKTITYEGRVVMNQIRALATRMQIREEGDLKIRREGVQSKFSKLRVIIIVSLSIAFLLLIFGFITYIRENKARQEADQKVQQYQGQLRERIMELRSVNKELLQMRSIEKFASTGRIARTIAHEVRNPLTNINLAMEQLKAEMPDQGDNGILFEMMHRNSSRINQLITDLLNSTKFAELTYTRISINTLADEALELAKDRIALHHISVVKKYSNDICDVAVDKDKLRIAFLNIIVNAIEAMEPGKGILTITTKGEGDKCIIEIADNGAGMDKESMSRLFEPYFTSKPKGNGLGLTNTQNIILNHKGTIQAESKKGVGTTFIISLNFT